MNGLLGTVGRAWIGISGKVGRRIELNSAFPQSNLSLQRKIKVMMHEMGHNLGFAHCGNQDPNSTAVLIPGTFAETQNPYALMYPYNNIDANSNSFFSVDEVNAACILFPKKNQQKVLILQPDSIQGQDVFLYSLEPNKNISFHPDFAAIAWTNNMRPVTVRSLLRFDMSSISPNSLIDSVKLYLYGYASLANGTHSTLSGENSAFLQRVTQNWNKRTVTWNTQPIAINLDQVRLPASSNNIQNYVLNVTAMTKHMISNPTQNYGYMLKLENEDYYRRLVFASSDNANANLHPKLEIYYKTK